MVTLTDKQQYQFWQYITVLTSSSSSHWKAGTAFIMASFIVQHQSKTAQLRLGHQNKINSDTMHSGRRGGKKNILRLHITLHIMDMSPVLSLCNLSNVMWQKFEACEKYQKWADFEDQSFFKNSDSHHFNEGHYILKKKI